MKPRKMREREREREREGRGLSIERKGKNEQYWKTVIDKEKKGEKEREENTVKEWTEKFSTIQFRERERIR